MQVEKETHQEYDTIEIRLASNLEGRINWIIGAFMTENETANEF
jgi:hypothetical protein